MPNKDEKIQITKLLESIFSKDDNISFYFLKKSKVTPESENKIPFKTKKKTSAEKVKETHYVTSSIYKNYTEEWN